HSNLQSEGACRFRYISQRGFGNRSIRGIAQYGDTNCLGHPPAGEEAITGDQEGVGRGTSVEKELTPVALPPGRARLATSPNLTGSSPTAKTIGIVEVAALAACAPKREAGVAITATRRRMSSSMSDGKRLYWPSSQWYSCATGPAS